MAKNLFYKNVSANTLQLIINQLFGLAIFYALSKGLSKNIFGAINFTLAILLTAFGVLTLGIDQLVVKKIAAGDDKHAVFSAYFFHVLIFGLIFYGLLVTGYFMMPQVFSAQSFIVIIGAGKLMIFFSTPFKQLVAGLEKFGKLFWMSVISNVIRGTALLFVLIVERMTVTNMLIIFIAGDLAELLLCVIIGGKFIRPFSAVRFSKTDRRLLLKESAPQAGVVLFTAIMARFDWILIGSIISQSRLAEYSFAWKVFELSGLPLLIIAPIMTALFARLHAGMRNFSDISFFLEWQIIISCFAAMLLNVCWTPVISFISDGKYGSINTDTIFLLSLSMPVLYFNNYFWTINFAEGKLKLIFSVMAIAFAVNVVSCVILIPLFKNEGAALANLLTAITQFGLYLMKSTTYPMPAKKITALLLWPIAAFAGGIGSLYLNSNFLIQLVVAILIFLLIVFFSKKIRAKDYKSLQSLYS